MSARTDTIFALATPPGRSAIAVIRITGQQAHQAAPAFGVAIPAAGRFGLARLRDHAGQQLDEALLLAMKGPDSSTGEDVLEIHPHDAENRGIRDGDRIALMSRSGETTLRAHLTERVQPGVVYTTFHHPETGANVVTTDYSDWATNCPEYKVTAVEVRPTNRWSNWQTEHDDFVKRSTRILVAE